MIAALLYLHFLADFVLQSREMGKKKSEEFDTLVQHVIIQFFVIYLGSLLFRMEANVAFRLALANMVIHGIIDWYIWRGYKFIIHRRLLGEAHAHKHFAKKSVDKLYKSKVKNFKYWEDHLFYTTIGFDQLLHSLTLIGLYSWLS